MNKIEKTRLTTVCCAIWQSLNEAERENYYFDCGLIGFIEMVATLLYMDIADFNDTDFDVIIDTLNEVVTI